MKVRLYKACLYNTSNSNFISKSDVSGEFEVGSIVAINGRYLILENDKWLGWVDTNKCIFINN